jgi:hypothetical protein
MSEQILTPEQVQILRQLIAGYKGVAGAMLDLPVTPVPPARFPTSVDPVSGRKICRTPECDGTVRITDQGNHGLICAACWETVTGWEAPATATKAEKAPATAKKAPATPKKAPATPKQAPAPGMATCHPDRPAWTAKGLNCAECRAAAVARKAARKG